ncbi:hypothetical protein B0A50_01712 [Salinomyces thailandicus]|uniref:Uncharacterized protein n=1 Tax=Salinomyces thailandicus TaxID=706561 RepID=A0A4U0UBJ8_9PEZI|nr:hypothetical protein B0A50_01712 [Salinomyces thailandica]
MQPGLNPLRTSPGMTTLIASDPSGSAKFTYSPFLIDLIPEEMRNKDPDKLQSIDRRVLEHAKQSLGPHPPTTPGGSFIKLYKSGFAEFTYPPDGIHVGVAKFLENGGDEEDPRLYPTRPRWQQEDLEERYNNLSLHRATPPWKANRAPPPWKVNAEHRVLDRTRPSLGGQSNHSAFQLRNHQPSVYNQHSVYNQPQPFAYNQRFAYNQPQLPNHPPNFYNQPQLPNHQPNVYNQLPFYNQHQLPNHQPNVHNQTSVYNQHQSWNYGPRHYPTPRPLRQWHRRRSTHWQTERSRNRQMNRPWERNRTGQFDSTYFSDTPVKDEDISVKDEDVSIKVEDTSD